MTWPILSEVASGSACECELNDDGGSPHNDGVEGKVERTEQG